MIKKIDIKEERFLLFIDTETIGTINNKDSVLPFEIGVKVFDNELNTIVKAKSYIVKRFFNNKYIMNSSFSANKYPTYQDKITKDNHYYLGSVNDIMKKIKATIERYNIKVMVAHNGTFDKDAVARLCGDFGIDNPFESLDLLDTMEISRVITFSKGYTNYCLKNKNVLNDLKESCFITNSGRVRTTAQAIYSYLIVNPNYKESHTALEDIDIEIEIYKASIEELGNTIVSLNVAPTWRDYSIVIEKN